MPKYRTPPYYQAPLRKRSDIAAFLADQAHYPGNYRDQGCRFVWDVKLYGLNLDYDHLLQMHKESGYCGLPQIDHPEVQKIYSRLWEEQMKNGELEEIAIEDAARDINDTDCYNHLWDGTNCDAKYRFYGRSGGYVGLETFLGYYDFTKENHHYWNTCFLGNREQEGTRAWREWEDTYQTFPYSDLRLLYKLVVMLNHDFTRERACNSVEYQAAYYLFASHEDEIEEEWQQIQRRQIHRKTSEAMEVLLAA